MQSTCKVVSTFECLSERGRVTVVSPDAAYHQTHIPVPCRMVLLQKKYLGGSTVSQVTKVL